MPQAAVDDLVALLDLEAIEVNIFRGVSPDEQRQRVFGGQVAGQALVAAARTVTTGHAPHSLHAYFLRPGDRAIPIVYQVDRIRDGGSFTTRRVVAVQKGRAIFNLQASFHAHEVGFDHQFPMPEVPNPERLPTLDAWMASVGRPWPGPQGIDIRHVEDPVWLGRGAARTDQHVWFRFAGPLGDDPILHTCLAAYASDVTLLDTALLPYGKTFGDPDLAQASLDHAMWFHRSFRADEWLLYAQHTPSATGARGLAQGSMFARDGRLVATVVQEGLIRHRSLRGRVEEDRAVHA
jgi:acyl-CoA thioesterase-2